MKTQVEFRSSKFPPYEGEQEQINPSLWGKRLAECFVQKLSEKGFKTEETNTSRSPESKMFFDIIVQSRVISLPGSVLTRRMKNRCRHLMTILRYSYLRATIGSTRMARRAGM
jgi:hypothetical protein